MFCPDLPVFSFVVGGGELFLPRVNLCFGLMVYFAAFALSFLLQVRRNVDSLVLAFVATFLPLEH